MTHVNLAHVVQNREGLDANEDVAIITMHFRGAEGLLPDSVIDMDDGRRSTAVGKIDEYLSALAPLFPTDVFWERVDWFNVKPDGTPGGARIDSYPLSVGGSAVGGALPPQIAVSVTLKTAVRKNWGRWYLPSIATSRITNKGRLDQTYGQLVADQTLDLAARAPDSTTVLTVWSPTERTRHDPQTVQVDDIMDVIRSRRYGAALFKLGGAVPSGP